MSNIKVSRFIAAIVVLELGGCASLVGAYDNTFDQSLNQLSQDTAKFLASAAAGQAESDPNSKESIAYYASSYNVLDRLIQRAALSRGAVSCPSNSLLKPFFASRSSSTPMPSDIDKIDCREHQLYAVRIYLDQLHYAESTDGRLNRSEATITGGALQTSIEGAIQTFIVNKPSK